MGRKLKGERQNWWNSLTPEEQSKYIKNRMRQKSMLPERIAAGNTPEVLADKEIIKQWRIEQAIKDKQCV